MCWYWFPINNLCRDALILLKVCRRIYHCKIQVKFNISNYLQNFGWVMVLFRLSFCLCVDTGFHSIIFAEMYWFYWKFADGYIIVKYRSSSILVIIRKILTELWPFFQLTFCWWLDIGFRSITFAGMHWFYWKFAEGNIIVKNRSSNIGYRPQNVGQVMALFRLSFCCWGKIQGFPSITFEGIHWFHVKFVVRGCL